MHDYGTRHRQALLQHPNFRPRQRDEQFIRRCGVVALVLYVLASLSRR